METKTYTKMDYSELDKLVNEYFPKANYYFQADEEVGNDINKTYERITVNNWEERMKSSYDLNCFTQFI